LKSGWGSIFYGMMVKHAQSGVLSCLPFRQV